MPKKRETVKDRATIFKSYIEAVDGLPEDQKKEWFYAIINRLFNGIIPDFNEENKILNNLWKLVEPNIKTSISRSNAPRKTGNKTESKDITKEKQTAIASPYPSPTPIPCIKKGIVKGNAYSEEFEECWKLYGSYGTKKKAFEYWNKLSAEDQISVKRKIPVYKEFLKATGYSQKMFQGWINPKERIWETTYENISHNQSQNEVNTDADTNFISNNELDELWNRHESESKKMEDSWNAK